VGETLPLHFGRRDPILGQADRPLIKHIRGAAGQPHARINASHFIREDSGPELAKRIRAWQQAVT
jgi:haloalkane dehalogenase